MAIDGVGATHLENQERGVEILSRGFGCKGKTPKKGLAHMKTNANNMGIISF